MPQDHIRVGPRSGGASSGALRSFPEKFLNTHWPNYERMSPMTDEASGSVQPPTPVEKEHAEHEVRDTQEVDCCVVGGGPGGVVLSLLLARSGIRVMLLEAHEDFDRDFRGDTLHPSVLEIIEEIGLSERLHSLRHSKLRAFTFMLPD